MSEIEQNLTDPTEDALRLINTELLPAIERGCVAVNAQARLADEAKELFKRRYRLSIENRLTNGNGPPSELELQVLRAVGNAHGKIAASIWEFRQKHNTPPPTIDIEVLTLAAHIMEFECRTLMIDLISTKKGPVPPQELEEMVKRGIFCW